MLTTFFRIGPLVLLELILTGAATIIYYIGQLSCCIPYSLFYFAVVTFLIETILALRLINKNNILRKKFIAERLQQSRQRYYLKIGWDSLILMMVGGFMLGLILIDTAQMAQGINDSSDCQFKLFSLCLFNKLENNSSRNQDSMIMWLLLVVSTFVSLGICFWTGKQYSAYLIRLRNNRKLRQTLGQMNDTLLDCQILDIGQRTTVSQNIKNQIGQCPICLHQVLGVEQNNKIIILKCGHPFHRNCIDSWLKVKDKCPYRCAPTDIF